MCMCLCYQLPCFCFQAPCAVLDSSPFCMHCAALPVPPQSFLCLHLERLPSSTSMPLPTTVVQVGRDCACIMHLADLSATLQHPASFAARTSSCWPATVLLFRCCSAAAITNYRIVAVPTGGGGNVSLTGMGSALPGGPLQFSFAAGSALAPGQQYRVYAYSISTAGTSLPSALASYTSPAT